MSWKSHEAPKWLRLYQASSFLSALDFSRSLFLVYFLHLGFSNGQLGILQTTLFWTSFLLDLPTGLFADGYGRKWSVLAGLLGLIAAYITIAIAPNFTIALIGFALWGAAYAFNSGASGALLYDGMKESGWLDNHIHLLGRVRGLAMLATAISIFIGGFLYQWSPSSIFWITAIAIFLSFVVFTRIPEPALEAVVGERRSVAANLRLFFAQPHGKSLLVFLVGMGLIEMVNTPFFIFSQILFHDMGVSEVGISLMLAGGFLGSAIVQNWAPRIKIFSLKQMIVITALALTSSLIGIWIFPVLWVRIALFFVIDLLPAVLFVHSDQYIQDRAESNIRASLLSVHSLTSTLMIGLSYLALGFVSERIGLVTSLAMLAPLLPLSIIVTFAHFRMERRAR